MPFNFTFAIVSTSSKVLLNCDCTPLVTPDKYPSSVSVTLLDLTCFKLSVYNARFAVNEDTSSPSTIGVEAKDRDVPVPITEFVPLDTSILVPVKFPLVRVGSLPFN